ncbi:exopolyphosphatase [Pasteurella atlantica]|uniref:Exopolyphosphatase n=2 Tax=Pasteurellaceae TaxID=712 RepID=A0ACC6HJ11_9PAST|nr:exopolyphosphatase [Pasteurella atlantica]MDP8050866.1 exopolyphosphatase [Pasteurella atlantica]MDP8104136.1 exopolyphosphatase [Pasteurella atlantica]MDP8147522.1 exopolyphosphatase [Pasteurella atlantica]
MQSTSTPREFAAIDLGSNSFHMIIARVVNGSIQILSRIKRQVRLAEGLNEERILSDEAIQRGVECLALFADRLQGFDPQNVKVIGTYTLRRAVNNTEFLRRAATVFPYPINIISGQEEATLIYLGASHTQPETGRKLIIDIGGGSTEMCIGDNFLPIRAESRHMGCVSFAQRFFPQGELNSECFEQAYQLAIEKIEDLETDYRTLGWKHVLGSSGTIKTVSCVLRANGYKDGFITQERLQHLIEKCLTFTSLNDIQLKGLLKERADVFVPGLAILKALFNTFQIESMRYSDGAVREGIMYSLDEYTQVSDIRQRTADSLALQFNIDLQQALRVEECAIQLFNQVPFWEKHFLRTEFLDILKWASQLHEVGITINHNKFNHHSSYILSHINLPGFDYEQQQLLATLVRYHIQDIKLNYIHSSYRYKKRNIITLLRIFRLATLLSRSRQASVIPQYIKLNIKENDWYLEFEPDYLAQNLLVTADLKAEQKELQAVGFKLEFA